MKLKFRVVFLNGVTERAAVVGIKEIDGDGLTVEELQQIVPTEQLLEKLLGLRVHIEQAP